MNEIKFISDESLVYSDENNYVFERDDIRLACTIGPKRNDFAYSSLF